MLLNPIDTGNGSDVALLLHGMMGSAESWWRVTDVLAERSYRVLSLDLPGHGLSARDPGLTVASAASSVVETVRHYAPGKRIFAMGHSFGGMVLAAAVDALKPHLAVHVETPLHLSGGADRDELISQYEHDRQNRTSELLASRPGYSQSDAAVESRAAELFDPATSASISCGPNATWRPAPGSIAVVAHPSNFITNRDERSLRDGGVHVRSIEGAAHTVWYSHFHEFVATVPELFGAR